jgi:HEPN domain-containing protein
MADLAFGESLWNQVCFHAHQAAEKNLKALIVSKGASSPKTHRLTDLLALLEDEEPGLKGTTNELLSLESYYIPTRYPDAVVPGSSPEDLPGREAAKEALAASRRISNVIHQAIGDAR